MGRLGDAGEEGEIRKIGEYPTFGNPAPAKVISIIGPDRELFLYGRQCENQGMGIGAFAYYRRAVENQWKSILEEIIRAATRLGAEKQDIETL
jgi:hypothetical protein